MGPTAAGKSDAAVAVALARGGEVLNADSMQVYRGMDVGTAKLTEVERRGVPHHLLDLWDVREPASVAAYQSVGRQALDDLLSRGRLPVVVGGSGLYVRGLLDRLEFPGTDPAVRAALEAELAVAGPGELHRRLAAADPAAAAGIQPGNGRRIVRALEVIELTGRPFSQRPGMTAYDAAYDTAYAGIAPPLAELDERIRQRVDRMWAAGFVEEVRALASRGLRDGPTAGRALGYQQILAALDGATSLDQAREATVVATRQFARRQLRWFRRDPRVRWYPTAEAAAAALLQECAGLGYRPAGDPQPAARDPAGDPQP